MLYVHMYIGYGSGTEGWTQYELDKYHEVIEGRKKANENITPVRSATTQQHVSSRSDTPLTLLVINTDTDTDTVIRTVAREEDPELATPQVQDSLPPIKGDMPSKPCGPVVAQNFDKVQPPIETQPDDALDSTMRCMPTADSATATFIANTNTQPPSVSPRPNSTLLTTQPPPAKPARPISFKSSSSAPHTQLPSNTPHTALSTPLYTSANANNTNTTVTVAPRPTDTSAVKADPSLSLHTPASAPPAPTTRRPVRVMVYLRGLTPFGTSGSSYI